MTNLREWAHKKLTVTQLVKNTSTFMKPRDSLACLQVPTIGLYLNYVNPVQTLKPDLSTIWLNIILQTIPRFSKWPLPFQYF